MYHTSMHAYTHAERTDHCLCSMVPCIHVVCIACAQKSTVLVLEWDLKREKKRKSMIRLYDRRSLTVQHVGRILSCVYLCVIFRCFFRARWPILSKIYVTAQSSEKQGIRKAKARRVKQTWLKTTAVVIIIASENCRKNNKTAVESLEQQPFGKDLSAVVHTVFKSCRCTAAHKLFLFIRYLARSYGPGRSVDCSRSSQQYAIFVCVRTCVRVHLCICVCNSRFAKPIGFIFVFVQTISIIPHKINNENPLDWLTNFANTHAVNENNLCSVFCPLFIFIAKIFLCFCFATEF